MNTDSSLNKELPLCDRLRKLCINGLSEILIVDSNENVNWIRKNAEEMLELNKKQLEESGSKIMIGESSAPLLRSSMGNITDIAFVNKGERLPDGYFYIKNVKSEIGSSISSNTSDSTSDESGILAVSTITTSANGDEKISETTGAPAIFESKLLVASRNPELVDKGVSITDITIIRQDKGEIPPPGFQLAQYITNNHQESSSDATTTIPGIAKKTSTNRLIDNKVNECKLQIYFKRSAGGVSIDDLKFISYSSTCDPRYILPRNYFVIENTRNGYQANFKEDIYVQPKPIVAVHLIYKYNLHLKNQNDYVNINQDQTCWFLHPICQGLLSRQKLLIKTAYKTIKAIFQDKLLSQSGIHQLRESETNKDTDATTHAKKDYEVVESALQTVMNYLCYSLWTLPDVLLVDLLQLFQIFIRSSIDYNYSNKNDSTMNILSCSSQIVNSLKETLRYISSKLDHCTDKLGRLRGTNVTLVVLEPYESQRDNLQSQIDFIWSLHKEYILTIVNQCEQYHSYRSNHLNSKENVEDVIDVMIDSELVIDQSISLDVANEVIDTCLKRVEYHQLCQETEKLLLRQDSKLYNTIGSDISELAQVYFDNPYDRGCFMLLIHHLHTAKQPVTSQLQNVHRTLLLREKWVFKRRVYALKAMLYWLRGCGSHIRSNNQWLYIIRRLVCPAIVLNCSSGLLYHIEIFETIFHMIDILFKSFKHGMKYEIGLIIDGVVLKIIQSGRAPTSLSKISVETLASWCDDSHNIADIFMNYDYDMHLNVNLFSNIVTSLINRCKKFSAVHERVDGLKSMRKNTRTVSISTAFGSKRFSDIPIPLNQNDTGMSETIDRIQSCLTILLRSLMNACAARHLLEIDHSGNITSDSDNKGGSRSGSKVSGAAGATGVDRRNTSGIKPSSILSSTPHLTNRKSLMRTSRYSSSLLSVPDLTAGTHSTSVCTVGNDSVSMDSSPNGSPMHIQRPIHHRKNMSDGISLIQNSQLNINRHISLPLNPKKKKIQLSSLTKAETATVIDEKSSDIVRDVQNHQGAINTALSLIKLKGNMEIGITHLVSNNIILKCAKDIVRFIRLYASEISDVILGDYLGYGGDATGEYQEQFMNEIRLHYLRGIDFRGMKFDEALRFFLTQGNFRLPGEAQKIERLVIAFAQCYFEVSCYDNQFSEADTVMVLAYSTILLNTDLHNPNIKDSSKMTLKQFIGTNRGIDNGNDLSEEMLTQLYFSIKSNGIKLPIGNVNSDVRIAISSIKSTVSTSADSSNHDNSLKSFSAFEFEKSLNTEIRSLLAKFYSLSDVFPKYESVSSNYDCSDVDVIRLIFDEIWSAVYDCIEDMIFSDKSEKPLLLPAISMLGYCLSTSLLLGFSAGKHAFTDLLLKIKTKFEKEVVMEGGVQKSNQLLEKSMKHIESSESEWKTMIMRATTTSDFIHIIPKLSEIINQLLDRIQHKREYTALIEIQTLFKSGSVDLLESVDRKLLKSGPLTKVSSKKRYQNYIFFLFNDILIYASKTFSGKYLPHQIIPLTSIVLQNIPQDKYKSAFHIESNVKSFVVIGENEMIKQSWISEFQTALHGLLRSEVSIMDSVFSSMWLIESRGTLRSRLSSTNFDSSAVYDTDETPNSRVFPGTSTSIYQSASEKVNRYIRTLKTKDDMLQVGANVVNIDTYIEALVFSQNIFDQDSDMNPNEMFTLNLYGLYKQSTLGDCKGASLVDKLGQQHTTKGLAWNEFANMDRVIAMSLYVHMIDVLMGGREHWIAISPDKSMNRI